MEQAKLGFSLSKVNPKVRALFPACRLKISNNSQRRTKRSHKLPSTSPLLHPSCTPKPAPTPHPERQPHRRGHREPIRNTCSAPSNVLQLPSTATHRVPGQDDRHQLPTASAAPPASSSSQQQNLAPRHQAAAARQTGSPAPSAAVSAVTHGSLPRAPATPGRPRAQPRRTPWRTVHNPTLAGPGSDCRGAEPPVPPP